ncbi:MAG: anaerobic ribonucleoside-triphosphate reductase activating protein [Clostridium sp.]|nr:anaerobic ribonucleoside-triphosphate reductase activating protein [Clostridium sp.]
MNYSKIRKFDVTNGPGIRTTLFVSGCTNNCPECFNKEQQDFNYGQKWDRETEESFLSYVKSPNVVGVSILGGEPMEQTMDSSLVDLLRRIKKETGKSIWLWSGFTYESIIQDEKKKEILECIDVLVDGRFIVAQRNLNLKYRGSENQRVINVPKSLEEGKVISEI